MQKYKNKLAFICYAILLVIFAFQMYENKMLSQDLRQLNWHVESQFSMSKEGVVPLLEAQMFCPEISSKLAHMATAALYGKYMEHAAVGPDSNWHELLVDMNNVLGNEQSFYKVKSQELVQLVEFLKTHEYRNNPEISAEDIQPLTAILEAAALREN